MTARSEYWLSRNEILRRTTEDGLDEREIDHLLYAFEAAVLREYAPILERSGDQHGSSLLKHFASGIRPRGWLQLLPSGRRAAS